MSTKTAIVILNWNGEQMLSQFLPNVIRNSEEEGVEIIVADNGSTDNSCQLIDKQFPTVRLVSLGHNYGFAEGYNRALKFVEAQYLILLNSDVEVTPGWLKPMIEYMNMHPEVAACQPKLLSHRRRDKFEYAGAAGGYIDKYGYPYCRGRVFETVEDDNGQYDDVRQVFWASGAALLVRKSVYDQVGGLDGKFFAHCEEIDLCWRIASRGHKIVCLPFSKVYHVGAATLKKENPKKTYLNFRNNRLMLYKNLPEEELGTIMRVRFALDIVAALVFLLQGNWEACKAVFRALRDAKKMKPEFQEARRLNLSQAVDHKPYGRASFCLPWESKIKRKKLFSQLGTA